MRAIGASDDLGQRAGLVAAVLAAATVEAADDALTQLGVPSLWQHLELQEAATGAAFVGEIDAADGHLLTDGHWPGPDPADADADKGADWPWTQSAAGTEDHVGDRDDRLLAEPGLSPGRDPSRTTGDAAASASGESSATGAEHGRRSDPQRRSQHPATDGAASRSQRRQQTQRRMLSYVVRGSAREELMHGQEALDGTPVDSAGVNRVLDHERSAGRRPVEQEHSNPGFDVESFDAEGTLVRRIEVKSTVGPWEERGVALSRRQYAENEREADMFWLYVVEYATDDARVRVHRLRNPVGEIGAYFFDNGWRTLAEADAVGLPAQREDVGADDRVAT